MTEVEWEKAFGEYGITRGISLDEVMSPVRATMIPPDAEGARIAQQRYEANSRPGPRVPTPGTRGRDQLERRPKPKQGRRPGNIDQDVTSGVPSRASQGQEANEEPRVPSVRKPKKK